MIDLTGYSVHVNAPSRKVILVAFGNHLEEFNAQFTREAQKLVDALRRLADQIEAASFTNEA